MEPSENDISFIPESYPQGNCLYILFSRQNTKIGRVIRVFLRNSRYTHVSVAMDSGLYAMYSFSRRRLDSPFSSGFVREYPRHFFLGGKDLDVKLCRVPFTAEEYRRAIGRLEHCKTHESRMLYNLYDALLLPLGRRARMPDAFTCVGFAAYLTGMDEVRDIGDLEARLKDCTVYEGSLRALVDRFDPPLPENDDYYERRGLIAAARDFFTLNAKLRRRRRRCAM